MSSRLRRTVLAVMLGCLLIGGAVAANVALLGIADGPHDRVGQLQLRLRTPSGAQSTTAPATGPTVVVTPPPVVTQADDRHEGRDD